MFIEHTCPPEESSHPADTQNAFRLWKVNHFFIANVFQGFQILNERQWAICVRLNFDPGKSKEIFLLSSKEYLKIWQVWFGNVVSDYGKYSLAKFSNLYINILGQFRLKSGRLFRA